MIQSNQAKLYLKESGSSWEIVLGQPSLRHLEFKIHTVECFFMLSLKLYSEHAHSLHEDVLSTCMTAIYMNWFTRFYIDYKIECSTFSRICSSSFTSELQSASLCRFFRACSYSSSGLLFYMKLYLRLCPYFPDTPSLFHFVFFVKTQRLIFSDIKVFLLQKFSCLFT